MSYGPPPNIRGMISLKVDNLSYRTTPDDLRRTFEKYGDVGDVYIPRDPFSRESRGFAFVRYYHNRDADDAMDSLDGATVDGREIRVQPAKYGRPSEPRRGRGWAPTSGGGGGGGRSRYRSRSRSRDRSRERERSRSRSRSRGRRSESRSPSRSRSRDRAQKSASKSRSRSPRD